MKHRIETWFLSPKLQTLSFWRTQIENYSKTTTKQSKPTYDCLHYNYGQIPPALLELGSISIKPPYNWVKFKCQKHKHVIRYPRVGFTISHFRRKKKALYYIILICLPNHGGSERSWCCCSALESKKLPIDWTKSIKPCEEQRRCIKPQCFDR